MCMRENNARLVCDSFVFIIIIFKRRIKGIWGGSLTLNSHDTFAGSVIRRKSQISNELELGVDKDESNRAANDYKRTQGPVS